MRHGWQWISAVLAISMICAWAPSALARQSTTYAGDRAALDRAILPELEQLAKWCGKQRLYAERDGLYRAILSLDPDHRAARKGLRYVRVSGGDWKQSKAYHRPRNLGTERLAEARERRWQLLRPFRDQRLALLESHGETLGPEQVEIELRGLVSLAPDDSALHAALGEVNHHGHWILLESKRTGERRPAMPFLARSSLDSAPQPEDCGPDEIERALEFDFRAGGRTPRLRVMGTVGEDEVRRTARIGHALGDYFRLVLRSAPRYREDLTVYLLTGASDRDRLLANWKGIDAVRASALSISAGGWITRERFGQWTANPARRLDGAARQTLGQLLMDEFGIDGQQGWAWEGLGLYLVQQMLGTRLTWFFDVSGYQPRQSGLLWARLQAPDCDWLQEGRLMLTDAGAPRLAFLIGRDVNAMSERDSLHAYVLAAYLVEGRPKNLVELLRAVGSGEHPTEAFERVLGGSLSQIEARMRRWLDETLDAQH